LSYYIVLRGNRCCLAGFHCFCFIEFEPSRIALFWEEGTGFGK